MRLGLLSDLHIAPTPTSRCTTPPDALLALVGRLHDACDRVLVLGDLFDLSRPRRPLAWRPHLDAIAAEHPALYDALMACDLVFGNHDLALAKLGVPEERTFQGGAHSLIALHGHQNDPLIKKVWGLPDAANFVAGWLERGDLSVAARALGDVPLMMDRVNHRARRALGRPTTEVDLEHDRPDRDVALARALVGQGWGIVAMGHSHALRLVPVDGGLFVNTGAHCHGFVDHAIVDTDEGVAQVWRDGAMLAQARHDGAAWSVDT
jgi:predicted phosphodiesterase